MSKKSCYDSIHNCPIAVFNRVMMTGDLSHLGAGTEAQLQSAWQRLLDEYIQELGLPQAYIDYLNHMKRASNYQAKAYLNGQRHLLNFADAEKALAVGTTSGTEKGNAFLKSVALISKAIGFRINPNEISIAEFEAYTKIADNGRKQD